MVNAAEFKVSTPNAERAERAEGGRGRIPENSMTRLFGNPDRFGLIRRVRPFVIRTSVGV